MMAVSIIGGGRWARAVAGVLSMLPNAPARIVIHSGRNSAGVQAWAMEKGLGGIVSVSAVWPFEAGPVPSAVIVANRAADHHAAAMAGLKARCPVLVEKPVAIPGERIHDIAGLADKTGTMLAASHVFLFARYFDAFVRELEKAGGLRQLSVEWIDGHADIRDGEVKSYDARVTVFDDVLPHVVPLVARASGATPEFHGIDVGRGGAKVSIVGRAGQAAIAILLERDGRSRKRLITAETSAGLYRLDFSQEPGQIVFPDGRCADGDPHWKQALRPMSAMLSAFLTGAGGAPMDERLSISKALMSGALADIVRAAYAARQADWLANAAGSVPAADRDYGLRELGFTTLGFTTPTPALIQAVLEQAGSS